MTRQMGDRSHQLALELVPTVYERPEQPAVRVTVRAQSRCGVLERARCEHGGAVSQRMSDCSGRLDQVELELERAEERGGEDRRMDRGADVVSKSRERQLRSARSSADRLLRLDESDGAPRLSKRDRSCEAVRPRPDDNGVKWPY